MISSNYKEISVKKWIKSKTPLLLTFFIFCFSFVKTSFGNYQNFTPEYVIIPIAFWSLFTPKLFGYKTSAFFGLLQDIMEHNILGLNILLFVLINYFLVNQKLITINLNFKFSFIVFSILAFLYKIIKFIIIIFIKEYPAHFYNTFISFFILTVSYLLFGFICYKFYKWFLYKRRY